MHRDFFPFFYCRRLLMATSRPSPLPPPSATASPVFIDSSLGTHLAMSVSPDDTIADIKRKIGIEHALCFPDVGKINVQALKVKRRGAFYHLSDTMLVRSAFDGSKGTWFLHVDVIASSISKHQGGTAEHFVNESREQLDGNHQLILEPSRNLDEDRPSHRKNISINDESNVREKQLSILKPGGCQIESLIDTSSGQLAAGNHNDDESTQMYQLERPEIHKEKRVELDDWVKGAAKLLVILNSGVFGDQAQKDSGEEEIPGLGAFDACASVAVIEEGKSIKGNDVEQNDHLIDANSEHVFLENKMGKEAKANSVEEPVEEHTAAYNVGGSLSGKKTSKLENFPREVHQDVEIANSAYQEELSSKLPDGDSSLIEHLTDDKKKKRKKRRSSKSQQTEVVSAMLSNNYDTTLPHKTKEPSTANGPLLKKNDAIGLVPEVWEGNHEEAIVNNHKDLIKKFDSATEQASENVADRDCVGIDTPSKKCDASDFGSESMAKGLHSNHVSGMDFPNKTAEADMYKVALDDNHYDVITESNVSPHIKEAAPFRNPAEVDSQIPANFVSKKRSRKNLSKSVLGSNDPAHSSEFANEENLKEQLGNDDRGMNKESDTRTNQEAPNHEDTAKLDSEHPSAGNAGRSHRKRRRKSEKAESTNFPSNNCEPVHSLEDLANKENCKQKWDGQERQELVVTTDFEALANTAVPDSGFPTNPDDTKSRCKKKKSANIELQDHESTQQDFAHSLVREVAEKKARKTMNDHHKELGKESNSLAYHGEATVLRDSEKVSSVVSSSTIDKSTHRRKRKSAKSDLSYETSGNRDVVHSSGSQITRVNFEKASTITSGYPGGAFNDGTLANETEQNASHENDLNVHSIGLFDNLSNKYEIACNSAKTDNQGNKKGTLGSTSENLGKELLLHMACKGSAESAEAIKCSEHPNSDNDKINFVDVFCPSVVQHGSVVSANELPSAETEPEKQHKSKRKRKSSKHDSACDLVYPSESDKPHIAKREQRTCDPGNQDSVDPIDKPSSRGFRNGKAQKNAIKRTINYNMNAGATSSDFMSPQNSHDSSVKENIQGSKPDTERSKHVYNSKEKTSLLKTAAKSLDHQDANASNDLRNESRQTENNGIVNMGTHAVQGHSNATAVASYKEILPEPAASSDSTEEYSPVQAKQYRLAVRKVSRKSSGKILNNKQKTSLVTPGTIFNDATSESSEDEFEFRNRKATATAASDTSSASSDSDGNLENMQTTGFKSVAYGGKDEGIDAENITLSQSSNVSKKGMPLDAILRSSSSYKKAKILASQSQAEDSESQPVDVVLETQPEFD